MTKCRSCGAPVFWARTTNDKNIPVDAEPVEDGNFHVIAGQVVYHLAPAMGEQPKYKSHFATCPEANAWRAKPEKQGRLF